MVRIFPAWIALSGLALVMADTKRTPEDFDWNSLTYLSLLPDHHPTNVNSVGDSQVAVLVALGWAWRAASVAATGIDLKNTIRSCKQTANSDSGCGPCIEGLFTTAIGFGGVASANKKLL
ncbi:hypothetical protein PENNAL_c0043G08087 [Penicillium nalgiovense]|uniref:Uncharacterized protein n=1 Tax=Penicillium nalgiovense TaxID=60175 RepID=A0A1V6Y0G5_PENNA|nr:hypothetical protein PENNAL_c0043G08087 [Penicillium nalgiovense]